MAIIKSILDTDLYKLTMQKAVLSTCPGVAAKYRFVNRRQESRFNQDFAKRLNEEINFMSSLYLTDEEACFLHFHCPYLDESYIQYLKNYRFNPAEISARVDVFGELQIDISGPWERAILWEVPLMAIISELYFSCINFKWTLENYENQTTNKALTLSSCNYSEFGTRRRRSYETQNSVIQTLKNKNGFQGTSNVHFAHMYDLRPIGTMAHEWIMGISALEGLRHANRHALRAWSKVFKGNLGIALTDTFGSDAFFEDFDGYTARLFDGVRHDSGDPHTFAEKTIKAYNKLHIDPLTKAIIFSDGLTPIDAIAIKNQWDKLIKVRFGIGTNFTNDFGPDSPALNMVIKLTECAGVPVVKLSDTPSKAIGDPDALRVAEWTFFKIPLDNANGH